jgi:hypothetical protein
MCEQDLKIADLEKKVRAQEKKLALFAGVRKESVKEEDVKLRQRTKTRRNTNMERIPEKHSRQATMVNAL